MSLLLDQLKRKADFFSKLRTFFTGRGFLEVHTDELVPVGAIEASIDSLNVSSDQGSFQLHTSPEFEMKDLLSRTHQSLFQICKCFRDDPPTGVHRIEFTMLEFYQVNATYHDMKKLMKELIQAIVGKVLPFEEFTIGELFKRELGLEPREWISLEGLKGAAKALGCLLYTSPSPRD